MQVKNLQAVAVNSQADVRIHKIGLFAMWYTQN